MSHIDRDTNLLKECCSEAPNIINVLRYMEMGANVNHSTENGVTPLHAACYNGYSSIVELLVKHPKIDVNATCNDGLRPLFIACYKCHLLIVQVLLNHQQIDVNASNRDGVTPLHAACIRGHSAIVHELLKHPTINVDAMDKDQETPLFNACAFGHETVVRSLLNHSFKPYYSIHQPNRDGKTPMAVATENGYTEINCLLQSFILQHQHP